MISPIENGIEKHLKKEETKMENRMNEQENKKKTRVNEEFRLSYRGQAMYQNGWCNEHDEIAGT